MTIGRHVDYFWAQGTGWSPPQLAITLKHSPNAHCFPPIPLVFYVLRFILFTTSRRHGALGLTKSVYRFGDVFVGEDEKGKGRMDTIAWS